MKHQPLTHRMIRFWSHREFVYEIRKVDPFTGKKVIGDKPRTFFDKEHYLKVLIEKRVREERIKKAHAVNTRAFE